MSASVEEISYVGGSDHHGEGGDADDDDEDDDIGSGAHARNDAKKRTSYGFGIGRDFGKAKQVVLHQFTKAKKQLHRRRSKRANRSSSSVVNASRTSGKRILEDGGGGGKGCYFCLTRPQVVESPSRSEISDPNDPNFTYGMLKTLIEKNDFYSKECNTHID